MFSQSSPVQQIMAGSPNNWWNINNMKSQISQHQQETATSDLLFPQFIPILVPPSSISSSASSSWNDNQKFPESLSQLLLAGLVGEEDKSTLAKKLENWDEQLLDHASSCSFIQVKNKRPPANSCIYGHGNIDKFHHHQAVAAEPTWSQTMPVSSPKSSVTTMSSTMVEFSNNMLDSKHPPPDHSSQCNSTATGGAPNKKARIQSSSTQSTFKEEELVIDTKPSIPEGTPLFQEDSRPCQSVLL